MTSTWPRATRLFLSLAGVCLAGCAVPIGEQRLVSKPAMQFSRKPTLSYGSRLASQIQPGLEAGAEQASVCTTCK